MKANADYINPENVAQLREALRLSQVSGMFLPSVYVLEMVSTCNLACVMCPNRQMAPADWGEVDIRLFERVLKEISPYCEFLMLYWMGEVTLHSQFEEALGLARQHIKGRIVLSTNMMLADKRKRRAILENVDIALCCIDRWDERAYENVRVGGSFEVVVDNTTSLLAERRESDRCEVVVKGLDIAFGSNEQSAFESYWSDRGARPLLAWLNDWAGTFPTMRNAASLPVPRSSGSRVPCADLWFKLVMNWRGEVAMCCFDWRYLNKIGRLGDGRQTLQKLWQDQPIVDLRSQQVSGAWAENRLCASCTTWGEPAEFDAYVDFSNASYFTVF